MIRGHGLAMEYSIDGEVSTDRQFGQDAYETGPVLVGTFGAPAYKTSKDRETKRHYKSRLLSPVFALALATFSLYRNVEMQRPHAAAALVSALVYVVDLQAFFPSYLSSPLLGLRYLVLCTE